jgi:hypothetical protein
VLQVPGLERKRRKRVRGWSWAWLGADWRTGAGDLPLPLEERRGRCKGGADRGRGDRESRGYVGGEGGIFRYDPLITPQIESRLIIAIRRLEGCKRGGTRLPAPRPHAPLASSGAMRPTRMRRNSFADYAAARMLPRLPALRPSTQVSLHFLLPNRIFHLNHQHPLLHIPFSHIHLPL